jgi:hypothetical protein
MFDGFYTTAIAERHTVESAHEACLETQNALKQ